MYVVLWLRDAEHGYGPCSPGEVGCSEGLGLILLFLSGTLLKTSISRVLGPKDMSEISLLFQFFPRTHALDPIFFVI